MIENGKLNDLAAAEIDALASEGIVPTPQDVVELNALGWAVETPHTRRTLARGVPVSVGGVTLWPITLQAADWLDRVGRKLEVSKIRHPIISPQMDTIVLAYAMANGYTENGAFDTEGEAAVESVLRFVQKLRCTLHALALAVDQVLGEDASPTMPGDDTGKPMSIGDFSAFLAAACGATPEFWERRCAVSYTFAVLTAIARQNSADGKPVAGDPKIEATRALGMVAETIRQRVKSNG